MRRVLFPPREHWRAIAAECCYDFHTTEDGHAVWHEGAAYAFTLDQIERDLEGPTAELHRLCLDLVAEVAASGPLMDRLGLQPLAQDLVRASWRARAPHLYGRFDLAYDGSGPAKLLEYNADTPTALVETAVFQWRWLEDARAKCLLAGDADQFNSVHDKLIARLARIVDGSTGAFFVASMAEYPEDRGTAAYIADCAAQAGMTVGGLLDVSEIGLHRQDGRHRFVNRSGHRIASLFKLYPWEWIVRDPFGASVLGSGTAFLEPAWKMILSNKGILPLLWERHPGHPNLLPAFFEDDPRKFGLGQSFVRKPLLGREGANVTIVADGRVQAAQPGAYAESGFIRQAVAPVPVRDGRHAVIGSWVVGDESAGIIVRESDGPISDDSSQLLPHFIAPQATTG